MTPRRAAAAGRPVTRAVQIGVVVLAVVMAAAPAPRELIESVYARGLYPLIRQIVTGLSSLTAVVLFDVVLIGGAAALLGWWGARLIRAPRGTRRRALAGVLGHAAVVAAALYLLFLTIWGLNYRRELLTTRLGYVEDRVTPDVMETLTASGIERLNQLFDATEDQSWPQLAELPATLGTAFADVQQQLDVIPIVPGLAPRRSLLTPFFRRAGIDGMVDPFSLQILVNDTVLPFERPFVTAHEWAHVAGFAHEAEANFVAWLTCLAGDERMQYSGWSFLVPRLLAALPPDAQERLRGAVGSGPLADFAAVRARLNRTVPVVRRNVQRLNDRYLRANRVASGIGSYGEALQLAVGTDLGRRQWPPPPPD